LQACTSNENIKGEKVTIIERNEDDSSRKQGHKRGKITQKMITVYTDASGEPHNIYGYCISETNEEKFIRSNGNYRSIE
jgi:hypothetical protein